MRQTGFVEAIDGTRIAWRAEGEGLPLVFCNGLANDAFQWGTVLWRLRGRARLITWDYPGHGESEPARTRSAVEIPNVIVGLRRVVRAAAGDEGQVVLLGYSLGCQLVLESWRTFSERIGALVCVLGTPGRPFETFLGARWLGRLSHGVVKMTPVPVLGVALKVPGLLGPVAHASSKVGGITEKGVAYRDFKGFFDHLGRLDAGSFRGLCLAAQRHSAEDLLPRVVVPTLVVAGGEDAFTPPALARGMDEALPDSELVFLPGASHAGLVGHGEQIAAAVEGFLQRRLSLAERE